MKRVFLFLLLFCIVNLYPNFLNAQYVPAFTSYRSVDGFSYYSNYQEFVDEFRTSKDYEQLISRLDSLANLSFEDNDYQQWLFFTNEIAQLCIASEQNQRGLDLLIKTKGKYSELTDTINFEYAHTLRQYTILYNRIYSTDPKLEPAYVSRIEILNELGIEGTPFTTALVDYGFYLQRIDFNRALDILVKARKSALKNNSISNMVGVDYAIISRIISKDFQETSIEVLQTNLDILAESKQDFTTKYYSAFFYYLLGDKLYNSHTKDYDRIIEANLSAIKILDSLNYPVWDIKSSVHSMLAYCYSEQDMPKEFWQHFFKTKDIILNENMSPRNRPLVLSNLADAALRFSPDSSKVLIDMIKIESTYDVYIERYIEIEARYFESTSQHEKTIELLTGFFPEYIEVDGHKMPTFTDSLDYLNQFSYFSRLQNALKELEEDSGADAYKTQILHLIKQQQVAYLASLSKDVFSNEPTLISKNYNDFVFRSLPYLISQDSQELDDLIYSIFFTSKAMQLVSNINKNATDAYIEQSSSFAGIMSLGNDIQQARSRLSQSNLSQERINELNIELSNYLIELLVLRYQLMFDTGIEIETPLVPGLAQVQSMLDEGQALIEFCINDDLLMYAIIRRDTAFSVSKQIEGLDRLMLDELRAVRTGRSSGNLSDVLLENIEPKLNGINNLVIIPDNTLSQIPFEWFVSPATGSRLIEDFTITYNYSTMLWYQQKSNARTTPPNSILLVAPVFEHYITPEHFANVYRDRLSLSALTYSKSEVEEIYQRSILNNLNATLLIGSDATEYNLNRKMGNFDILHIASHSVANTQRPELSGIFLNNEDEAINEEDNFLSLGEIYNSNLSADLVVLSSCESGIGGIYEGEGVMALPRGFIYAGVPNILFSLWKVHDERTKFLMASFYEHLMTGLSYAEALRRAKLDCINKGYLPLDWSGFVLIGH